MRRERGGGGEAGCEPVKEGPEARGDGGGSPRPLSRQSRHEALAGCVNSVRHGRRPTRLYFIRDGFDLRRDDLEVYPAVLFKLLEHVDRGELAEREVGGFFVRYPRHRDFEDLYLISDVFVNIYLMATACIFEVGGIPASPWSGPAPERMIASAPISLALFFNFSTTSSGLE